MPTYDHAANLWAFAHIDDLATLFAIGFELDRECEVLTVSYQGRQSRFSTEGWVGLQRTSEHPPHVYLDFLAQVNVSSYGNDFEEWAISHGREVDEQWSRVLWRYYRLLTSRLQRLFAEDFEYIMQADITMPRAVEGLGFSLQLVARFTRLVQARATTLERLTTQDVEPLLRAAQDQGWGAAFRHWLLMFEALEIDVRRALVTRVEREAAAS